MSSEFVQQRENKGSGKYFMFHWKNKNLEPFVHWFKDSPYLSQQSKNLIQHVSDEFITKLHKVCKWDELKLDDWNTYPGLVYTINARHQVPHSDFKDSRKMLPQDREWIGHMPLQEDGAILSMFDTWCPEEEVPIHQQYVYIPFGCLFFIRSDRVHAGFFGDMGNIRFHHCIMKGAWPQHDVIENCVSLEKIYDEPNVEKRTENVGKIFENMKRDHQVFWKQVAEEVLQHSGGHYTKKDLGTSNMASVLMEGQKTRGKNPEPSPTSTPKKQPCRVAKKTKK